MAGILKPWFSESLIEAGCDEAGRGCLAGPVFAAATILPKGFYHPMLDDSKRLSANRREILREVILNEALTYAVASMDAAEIDEKNILRASLESMHKALNQLNTKPALILVDGNRFLPYHDIPYKTIIGGDGLYAPIAAASVLAKTYRDDYMRMIHREYPMYGWDKNKGYGTAQHVRAILQYGLSPYHRKTFHLKGQRRLFD